MKCRQLSKSRSYSEVFCKKLCPKNFAKLTGKNVRWRPCFTYDVRSPSLVFFSEFREIFQDFNLEEHLWVAADVRIINSSWVDMYLVKFQHILHIIPLSVNSTKYSNTLKQFVANLLANLFECVWAFCGVGAERLIFRSALSTQSNIHIETFCERNHLNYVEQFSHKATSCVAWS